MVCGDVKRIVYFFLDGTLGSNRSEDLMAHLGTCPSCGERVTIQRRLRTFVRSRLSFEPAPMKLRERVSALWRIRPDAEAS
jgi:mycothiol system anti-sigma-R factor